MLAVSHHNVVSLGIIDVKRYFKGKISISGVGDVQNLERCTLLCGEFSGKRQTGKD